MSRRSALKIVGFGSVGLASVGAGAGLVRAGTNGVFNAGQGAPYELWHEWPRLSGVDRVIAAGLLSCNPHNTQPWFLVVEDEVIELRSDPSRRMPANDASDREHYAGLGCALESMVVVAGSTGYSSDVEVFPDPVQPELVARLTLRQGRSTADLDEGALVVAVPERHTNRGPYTTRPIPGDTFTALTGQAARVDGADVVWVTDPGQREALGRLYVEATEAIVADEEQSREAFSWFRSGRSAIDEHRDGLTLDCQGLDTATLVAAKLLQAQSRASGDEYWVEATRDVHTATAAAYGIVTVTDVYDRAAQVAGGRLLTRLHLTATARGVALHHMNQITERIDRVRALREPDVFSARWSAVLDRPSSTCLLSFRIGFAERDAHPSPRRAVGDVVTRSGTA